MPISPPQTRTGASSTHRPSHQPLLLAHTLYLLSPFIRALNARNAPWTATKTFSSALFSFGGAHPDGPTLSPSCLMPSSAADSSKHTAMPSSFPLRRCTLSVSTLQASPKWSIGRRMRSMSGLKIHRASRTALKRRGHVGIFGAYLRACSQVKMKDTGVASQRNCLRMVMRSYLRELRDLGAEIEATASLRHLLPIAILIEYRLDRQTNFVIL